MKLLHNAKFWRTLRIIMSFGFFTDKIKNVLNSKPNEKVLDFGCGVGDYCTAVKGDYYGVDLNPDFINYAKNKYKDKTFEVRDILETKFVNNTFDKSMYISMMHHFNDIDNARILEELAKVTKKFIIIVDLYPSKNPFRWFMQKNDQGKFLRPLSRQSDLIRKYFDIIDIQKFYSNSHNNSHSLFIARPKKCYQ